jgi:hypothetical protein
VMIVSFARLQNWKENPPHKSPTSCIRCQPITWISTQFILRVNSLNFHLNS